MTFEEINKHFVDQDKRIEDLRQERKSGDNNPLVDAGGGATPPGNQPPPSSQRDQVPQPVLLAVEFPVRYSRTSLRDVQPVVEPHVPWKSNPPVFSGDSSDYASYRKKALVFAEYVGFGDVFICLGDVPVAEPSISVQQMRNMDCTMGEIDQHRKVYHFLRSALKTKVDLKILYRARSPAEAWMKLESWHNPRTITATQSLHQRFQDFTMRPGQNPMFVLSTLEEMAAQLMQQDFSMAPNQALIQFLPIVPDSEYEIEKRTFSNVLHLDREQVLLAIRTRYENLQCQRRKSGARRDAGHAFITDAGNEKFGGKYPPGFRGRGRGMGRGKDRGRGRGGRKQGSDSDKSGDPKDDSVKGKRCGDVGHKAVRCPGQLCGVCGGKGHADDICANVVFVLACQAPADDKTLSGEEEEAVICKTSGKMSGALSLSGKIKT